MNCLALNGAISFAESVEITFIIDRLIVKLQTQKFLMVYFVKCLNTIETEHAWNCRKCFVRVMELLSLVHTCRKNWEWLLLTDEIERTSHIRITLLHEQFKKDCMKAGLTCIMLR